MRFYNGQHRFYAGIDLHARFLRLGVLDGRRPVPARRDCNPVKKKATQTQGQARQGANQKCFKVAKKNLQDSVVRALDFQGHLAVRQCTHLS